MEKNTMEVDYSMSHNHLLLPDLEHSANATSTENPANAKEAKQMINEEEKRKRAEHSKSGANTHGPQGMDYVPRKNHYADVPHNR
jgi:hypothetical protein